MHSLCIIKMILVLKAQTWSYFSCYDCNFLSSFSFAGADKCFDACETTPFCPDFYTCVLPNSNMALSTAIINHTYKWMAFKRVCLSIMEWNIFVAVFLKGCLSCNGCFILRLVLWTDFAGCFYASAFCCQKYRTCTRLSFQEPGLILRKSGQLVSHVGSLQQVSFLFHKTQLKCCAGSQGGWGGKKRNAEGKT